jgi:octopine/nopaline transport system permease protein
MEITGIARTIISNTYAPVEIFRVAGSIYLLINFIITRFIKYAEYRLNHGSIQ